MSWLNSPRKRMTSLQLCPTCPSSSPMEQAHCRSEHPCIRGSCQFTSSSGCVLDISAKYRSILCLHGLVFVLFICLLGGKVSSKEHRCCASRATRAPVSSGRKFIEEPPLETAPRFGEKTLNEFQFKAKNKKLKLAKSSAARENTRNTKTRATFLTRGIGVKESGVPKQSGVFMVLYLWYEICCVYAQVCANECSFVSCSKAKEPFMALRIACRSILPLVMQSANMSRVSHHTTFDGQQSTTSLSHAICGNRDFSVGSFKDVPVQA